MPARCTVTPFDLELVAALRERAQREETGLFAVEGVRFLIATVDAGADVAGLVVCKRLLTSVPGRMVVRRLRRRGVPTLLVQEDVLAPLSRLRDGSGRGVIAVVRQRWRPPHRIGRRETWLAVHDVRSLGNLGTLLRTCLAVGARGVFLLDDVDPFDPACVRATMGALMRLEFVRLEAGGLSALVAESGAKLVGASPHGKRDFRLHRYRDSTVLLLGGERSGIRPELARGCHTLVRIPMQPGLDSLNLAVAGSLVLYEIFAQRERR